MEEQLQKLIFNPSFEKIAIVLIGIVIIWVIIKIIQKYLFPKIKDKGNRYHAKKIGNFAGYFFTLILLATTYSGHLGNFTVALGVAGAGIAFALQEVIASFAGWLAIMFGGFYKTGERVQLGGIKGDVMDIGILRTTIMEMGEWVDGDLYNGRIVLVANSFVFKEPVYNYSGDFTFLWDEIKIPIQFGSDYEKTKEVLLAIGKAVAGDLSQTSKKQWNHLENKFRLEDSQTEPMVSLIANSNWVEYTLRYVVDYKKRRATKTQLFSQILKEIEATKGKVKFASSTPVFNVNFPDKQNE